MINITSIINDMSDIPYKLVQYTDKSPNGLQRWPANTDLKLMVFKTGDIIGTGKIIIYDPYGYEHVEEDSLVIGKTNNHLAGPIIKYNDKRIGLTPPFASTRIRFIPEEEVLTSSWGWYDSYNANRIERRLEKMRDLKSSDALYRQVRGKTIFFDNETKDLVDEVHEKAERFQKVLKYYKTY